MLNQLRAQINAKLDILNESPFQEKIVVALRNLDLQLDVEISAMERELQKAKEIRFNNTNTKLIKIEKMVHKVHQEYITACLIQQDLLITGSYDQSIRLWKVQADNSLKELSTFVVKEIEYPSAILYIDGKIVVANNEIYLYVQEGEKWVAKGSTDNKNRLIYKLVSLGDKFISVDPTYIKIWKTDTLQHIGRYDVPSRIEYVSIDSASTILYYALSNGSIYQVRVEDILTSKLNQAEELPYKLGGIQSFAARDAGNIIYRKERRIELYSGSKQVGFINMEFKDLNCFDQTIFLMQSDGKIFKFKDVNDVQMIVLGEETNYMVTNGVHIVAITNQGLIVAKLIN